MIGFSLGRPGQYICPVSPTKAGLNIGLAEATWLFCRMRKGENLFIFNSIIKWSVVKKNRRSPPQKSLSKLWISLLLASLIFNLYQYSQILKNKTTVREDKSKTAYPKYLSLNRQVTCENTQIDKNTLPLCPAGPKPRILPRHYPLHSIYLGYTEGIERMGLFQIVLNIVSNLDPKIPLVVMVPRDQAQMAANELDAYLNDQNKDLVQLVYTPADYTIWAQDYFEQAVNGETGAHYFIDLPYEGRLGEHIPSALALACNSGLISQAGIDYKLDENVSGNYGGNIESITDDLLLVGNTLSPDQRAILERELSQEVLDINVNWLKVGHVDELISVIPVANKKGKCPFDILYSSPGLALELIKKESEKSELKPLRFRFDFGEKQSTFNLWECHTKGYSHPGCKAMISANTEYEKIVQSNISKIKQALVRKDKSCSSVNFVKVPVLFTASQSQQRYGLKSDKAMTIDPNPVNNVLIGNNIIIPQQGLRPLYQYTKSVLEKYQLNVTAVDGEYVHIFDGGLHCSMNMRRTCRPRAGIQ